MKEKRQLMIIWRNLRNVEKTEEEINVTGYSPDRELLCQHSGYFFPVVSLRVSEDFM